MSLKFETNKSVKNENLNFYKIEFHESYSNNQIIKSNNQIIK